MEPARIIAIASAVLFVILYTFVMHNDRYGGS